MGMRARCSGWWYKQLNLKPIHKEQRAMSRITIFVGLDYHQNSVQVCVLDKKGKMLRNRSCANHWRAIVEKVRGAGAWPAWRWSRVRVRPSWPRS